MVVIPSEIEVLLTIQPFNCYIGLKIFCVKKNTAV